MTVISSGIRPPLKQRRMRAEQVDAATPWCRVDEPETVVGPSHPSGARRAAGIAPIAAGAREHADRRAGQPLLLDIAASRHLQDVLDIERCVCVKR